MVDRVFPFLSHISYSRLRASSREAMQKSCSRLQQKHRLFPSRPTLLCQFRIHRCHVLAEVLLSSILQREIVSLMLSLHWAGLIRFLAVLYLDIDSRLPFGRLKNWLGRKLLIDPTQFVLMKHYRVSLRSCNHLN